MTANLEWKIYNLPDSPGCYLMKSEGRIIYVGKAKNLKNRVSQYFHASRNHTPKVQAMVEKIELMAGKMLNTLFHVSTAERAKNNRNAAKSGTLLEILGFLL